MRISWKFPTAVGAALLVVTAPTAGAHAAVVPSPQSGVSLPTQDGPPNAYNPTPQGADRSSQDTKGGPQTGKPPVAPVGRTGQPAGPAGQKASDAPVGAVPQRNSMPQKQAPDVGRNTPGNEAPKTVPNTPADPKMPAEPKLPDENPSNRNLPNLTAPQDGPAPGGPITAQGGDDGDGGDFTMAN